MSFWITYTDQGDLFAIDLPIIVKYSLQGFYEKFGNTLNTPVPYLLWEISFYEKL